MRSMIRVVLAAIVAAGWFGCSDGGGGGNGGVPPDPPQVSVTLEQPVVAGTHYRLTITVTGCGSAMDVKKVELLDGPVKIRTITFTGNPMQVDLAANEMIYTSNGIAANPLFIAQAFCVDGRYNKSAPMSGRFFPVETVIQAAGGARTVPDSFIAVGTPSGTTQFIGCSEDPSSGQRQLVLVDSNGSLVTAQTGLPIPCSAATSFTERNPVTNKRWMLEPYDKNNPGKPSGLIEIDDGLNMFTVVPAKVFSVAVGPDGGAVYAALDEVNPNQIQLRKAPDSNALQTYNPADNLWRLTVPSGEIISNIVIDKASQVVVATWQENIGANTGSVLIDRFDYRFGALAGPTPSSAGPPLSRYLMRTIPFGLGGGPPAPMARLNQSGTIVYFPMQISSSSSQVLACATRVPGCNAGASSDGQPGGLVWQSPTLAGSVLVAQPYADDSRVAAIAPTQAYFLSAFNATIMNPQPILPEGALNFLGYQEGRGRDFYLLSGLGTVTEIVGLDTAESGEVFRFGLVNGDLTVAVGEDGRTWMRVNNDLLKLHRLVEYRRARTP